MSQKEGVVETIGEHEYTMYMLPPIQSHNLLIDVAKMVGPALGSLIGSLMPDGKSDADTDTEKESLYEREVDGDLLSGAVAALFRDLNKQTFEQVIAAFKSVTHVDGKELNKIFDFHFRGELDQMYLWLSLGVRVQWGKSLSALVSGASGPGVQALQGLLRSQST